jgi:maltose alpha-D-glucosyltransferase/alpha-amylase
MPRIYMALRQEDRLPITDIMAQTPPIPESCQWGLFLRNHDELTLEMVTDDERDYMYFAYSADPRMRVNVGIRRRLAPLVDNNRRRIELLNSLLLSFPGTPILYYGDELGMGDNIYLGDRNGVRTPMQWTSDRNAGFSKCDPARLYFPVIMDPIYGYQVVNVEAQLSDQSSLLHWTRNMIALRKLFQVFGRGSLEFLNLANRKILAYLRNLERGDGTSETVLCVANLSRFAQPVSLDLAAYAGMEPVEMLGYVPFPTITEVPYSLTLAPYSFLWLELQPANVTPEPLSPAQLEAAEAPAEIAPDEAVSLDVLRQGWQGLLATHCLDVLEGALPGWLARQRWFGGKSRTIQSVRVLDWVELPLAEAADGAHDAAGKSIPPALFFIEIAYAGSPADVYQLPLAFSVGAEAEEVATGYPQSVLATLAFPMGPAVLHDATIQEKVRRGLLRLIERNATLALKSTSSGTVEAARPQMSAAGSEAAVESAGAGKGDGGASKHHLQPRESPSAGGAVLLHGRIDAHASNAFSGAEDSRIFASRVGSAEQSNTSIIYGSQLILKLFRRLQPGENPDVEIGRFLTEEARFRHIPPFLGEITVTQPGGKKTTAAMLQGLVANQGDGWQWFLGRLAEFFPAVAELPGPIELPAPGFDKQAEPPGEIREHAGSSLEAAALLGRRTGEMHLALASPTDDAAFAAEPLTAEDLAHDAHRIEAQIVSALEALKRKMATLDDLTADDAARVLSRRVELLNRAHAITSVKAAGQRIRIHGDYHLGQTLHTHRPEAEDGKEPGDFVLLDFEGEPARPLAERRQKQSPLKDVACMLRSFSYAAFSGLDQYLKGNGDAAGNRERLSAWSICWQNAVSAEFLRAYRKTVAAKPALLPLPEQAQPLLGAYLFEKALYELLYELNNRPAWLRIPLASILAL